MILVAPCSHKRRRLKPVTRPIKLRCQIGRLRRLPRSVIHHAHWIYTSLHCRPQCTLALRSHLKALHKKSKSCNPASLQPLQIVPYKRATVFEDFVVRLTVTSLSKGSGLTSLYTPQLVRNGNEPLRCQSQAFRVKERGSNCSLGSCPAHFVLRRARRLNCTPKMAFSCLGSFRAYLWGVKSDGALMFLQPHG